MFFLWLFWVYYLSGDFVLQFCLQLICYMYLLIEFSLSYINQISLLYSHTHWIVKRPRHIQLPPPRASNHHAMINDFSVGFPSLSLYPTLYISALFLLLLPNGSCTLIYGYYGIQSTWQSQMQTAAAAATALPAVNLVGGAQGGVGRAAFINLHCWAAVK